MTSLATPETPATAAASVHAFESLGLRPELLRAIADSGYTVPTPVQAQAIPVILQGKDILAGAQTGTGKTAGFTLPLLQRLQFDLARPAQPAPVRVGAPDNGRGMDNNRAPRPFRPIRCLILTPTRELAAQVEESVRVYGKHLPLTSTVVFGGVNINPQIGALRRGVDILVATPGRLLDHVQQRTLDLSRVEILVLDEADRMLDMGFIRDIRRILALLPTRRQNLLFSATFTEEIKRLADDLLDSPTHINVARQSQESELVTQSVYLTSRDSKRDLLVHLLAEHKIQQALVFTRTKHGADRLAQQLQRDGIKAVPIHGNRSQPQRTKALEDFKSGAARILVATDIAARGLDIDQLPYVINFELPNVPEDYVHRIGRTGRAGSVGEAISLVCGEEYPYLAAIERLAKKSIEQRTAPTFSLATPAPYPGANMSGGGGGGRQPMRPSAPRSNGFSAGPQTSRGGRLSSGFNDSSRPARPASRPAGPVRPSVSNPSRPGNSPR